jgi:hypothetical protein
MSILDVVAHFAWPLVVLSALVLFRKPISEILGRINLTKVSLPGGSTLEFGPALALAESAAPKIEFQPEPPSLEADPDTLVTEAVGRLNITLSLNDKSRNRPGRKPLRRASPEEVGAMQVLLDLGARVATHRTTVTREEAEKYVAAVDRFVEVLKQPA